MEQYFGSFTQDSLWYWASAGKTMTSFLIGKAVDEGLIQLNLPSKTYLGSGWSSCSTSFENGTTVRNHLTMSTELNRIGVDLDCTLPSCLTCVTNPDPWFYHNAPYTLLYHMLDSVTPNGTNSYLIQKLGLTAGIVGSYVPLGYNRVFVSRPRAMARFGLLVLNRGTWNGTQIIPDGSGSYFEEMVNTSQSGNESYGYLWWLNGKSSHMLPGTALVFNGPLIPSAPSDLIAGLGKNDQKLYVVPSQNRVIIRLGEDGGQGFLAASSYDDQLWTLINGLDNSIGYEEHLKTIDLYPNPSNGDFLLPESFLGHLFVLYNQNGKVLFRKRLTENGRISLDLPAGLYFLVDLDTGSKSKVIIK